MKIIDEKGRLFGKINIIDFFVIVFFLTLVPMFYFGYKLSFQKPIVVVEQPKDFIDFKRQFDFINLTPAVLKLISIGDSEKDSEGKTIAEITDIQEPLPQINEFDLGEGNKFIEDDPVLKHMIVTLSLKAERRGNSLYYKNKPITVISPVNFITDKYGADVILVKAKKQVEEASAVKIETSEINSIKNEIAMMKADLLKIGLLFNKINILENQIAELKLSLANHENQIAELKLSLANHENQIAGFKLSLTNIDSQMKVIKKRKR